MKRKQTWTANVSGALTEPQKTQCWSDGYYVQKLHLAGEEQPANPVAEFFHCARAN